MISPNLQRSNNTGILLLLYSRSVPVDPISRKKLLIAIDAQRTVQHLEYRLKSQSRTAVILMILCVNFRTRFVPP